MFDFLSIGPCHALQRLQRDHHYALSHILPVTHPQFIARQIGTPAPSRPPPFMAKGGVMLLWGITSHDESGPLKGENLAFIFLDGVRAAWSEKIDQVAVRIAKQ